MTPHTITPAARAVCHCKAKAGSRRSTWGLYTQTRLSSLLRSNLDLLLKTTWFHSAADHSKGRRRWVGVKGSTHNGRRDPKRPSARCLRMVRKDSRAPSEGDTCAWRATDESIGCTRAFLMMWWSSR
ncbi:uncharacterized protein TNCV_4949891 [Trichonephila clavipes]|nr:uncharacterized protein TNCV_4949891 [Trichonephila clavipes]